MKLLARLGAALRRFFLPHCVSCGQPLGRTRDCDSCEMHNMTVKGW